ncbi:hypothetical protein ACFPPD_06815 [Cohnella suwonensis]|uniref:Phage protein n=1 Tax=Cohnella suwonensis TaxID=696072 RepID=A0ABW0LUQ9_9BACL
MNDWKKRIVDKVVEHNARRAEVHSTLTRLVNELKNENGISSGGVELASEHPLTWDVTIERKMVQVTESEVSRHQVIFEQGKYGGLEETNEKKSVEDALKELLATRFG